MARSRDADGPDGLLVVDKPAGWTSHDVVGRVRRLILTWVIAVQTAQWVELQGANAQRQRLGASAIGAAFGQPRTRRLA